MYKYIFEYICIYVYIYVHILTSMYTVFVFSFSTLDLSALSSGFVTNLQYIIHGNYTAVHAGPLYSAIMVRNDMCIYLIYVYTYLYICINIQIYIFIYIRVSINTHTCINIYEYNGT
jgi:hypothetical protein